MAENKRVLFLSGILIIAAFFRLYQIKTTPPGLYPDEAVNGTNALQALRSGDFRVFYPDNNGREGLLINIQAFFLKIFKANEPWVLRLPVAIAGILTVLGLYFLASELFGPAAGLLSSFFLAASFWHILFSRIGFRATLAPLLLVWSVFLFIRAMERPSKKILFATVAGIVYGLGFYTYIAYRITPLLFLLFTAFFRKQNGFWKITAMFLLAIFLVALPIGYYFLKNPADFFGRTSEISIFNSGSAIKNLALNTLKTLGMFNFRGDYNWRHNLSGDAELFWPVGILFIFGVVVSAIKIFRSFLIGAAASRENFAPVFVSAWFILALFPVVISNEGLPHALRSVLLIPPAFIFAALGGVKLYELLKKHCRENILKIALIIFFCILTLQAYDKYFIIWANDKNTYGAYNADYVEIGREINALPAGAPKYVVVQAGGVPVNGIPMPAQTVMFITDSYSPQGRAAKNIHYVLPNEESRVPPEALKFYLK